MLLVVLKLDDAFTNRFDVNDQCNAVFQQHVLSYTRYCFLHQNQVRSDVHDTLHVVFQKLSFLKEI